jgi:Ca2+-binding RTX toxin-like protein
MDLQPLAFGFKSMETRRKIMPFGFISGETQVNSSTAGNQRAAKSAPLHNGGYVTVWASDTGDGSGKAIMGQIFDSNGAKVGSEFLINTTTAGDQDLPDVIAYDDVQSPGGVGYSFIVVWQSAEANGSVIRGRRFLEDGTAAIMNPHEPGNVSTSDVVVSDNLGGTKPALGMYGTGRLAIVWEATSVGSGTGIGLAHYRSGLLGATILNTTTIGDQVDPRIADSSSIGATIVWESREPGGDVIRASSHAQANVFTNDAIVNVAADEDESLPNVAEGGTLVIWNSGSNIMARDVVLADARATPTGSAFVLNSAPGGGISRSDIVGVGNGNYVAVYFTQDSGYSIRVEYFNRTTGSLSGEVFVPQNFNGTQEDPSIIKLANGKLVVTWASDADALGNFEVKQRLISLTANEFSGDSGDNVLNGTPNDDLFFVQQGGNDIVNGLEANDIVYFGSAMTSQDAVDGGTGNDRIEIQGNYTGANALTLGTGVVNVETVLLRSGTDTSRGDPGGSSYSYHITTQDVNVTSVRTMEFDGSALQAGENFTFRGGAETTGHFTVRGGLGVDDFVGGTEPDHFVFGNGAFGASDVVNGGGGQDTLVLSGNYTVVFGAGQLTSIEVLELVSGFDTPANSAYHYHVTMNDANLTGGFMHVNAFRLRASESLIFFGDAETNAGFNVTGGAGNDYFVSGSQEDLFDGQGGIDTVDYRSATAGVVVTLGSGSEIGHGAGVDLLRIENVVGSAFGDSLYGNSSANTLDGANGDDLLVGGGGDDFLYGGAGADRMEGGTGNDFYTFDNAGDVVVELAGEGTDTVATSISYGLRDNIENLQAADIAGTAPIGLSGNGLAHFIWGNQGDNVIDGGGGADFMIGYAGNDSYQIDNVGDVAYELDGGGSDTVISSINYTLAANVENLQATNIGGSDPLALTGNGLNNFIWATQGNNVIDGAGGADFMIGYAGDDLYFVDNPGDIVYELSGQGTDTVATLISYTLAANVENLQAAVIGGTAALALTGNALSNFIWATQGNNIIDGGGGADFLIGFGGDDVYYVDNAGDVVFEEAGGGSDTVAATASYTLGANVENLQAADIGGSAALNLTGNDLGNYIWGTQGNNVLAGGGGIDRLFGYAGADQFLFNTAAGVANYDVLGDFQAGIDKIALDNGIFTALADGALPASAFVAGTAALDADDRILFNAADGSVYYDADGSGAGAALLVAYVPVGQVLTAADFIVV